MLFDKPQNLNCNKLAQELQIAGIEVSQVIRTAKGNIVDDNRFFVEKDKLRFGFEVPKDKVEIAKQIVESHNGAIE